MGSRDTIIDVKIDADAAKKHEDEKEMMDQLFLEKLPGSIKSRWALEFKQKMDIAIEDALKIKAKKMEKGKTKGRFQIQANTNAGKWMIDREWVYKANPKLKEVTDKREDADIALMKKRYHQKMVQNMDLEK